MTSTSLLCSASPSKSASIAFGRISPFTARCRSRAQHGPQQHNSYRAFDCARPHHDSSSDTSDGRNPTLE
eukprot:15451842-Alexandrium_andersonii.AAC.1